MKYNILTVTALAFSTLASSAQLNVHGLEDLVPRDIDPKTMDPTRLSVLSVLRTAIPSGTDFPKPSGDFEPDWYKNLPADVKSLLPSLYPVTITSTSTSTSTSTATVHVSAAASTPTSVAASSEVSSAAVSATTPAPSVTSQLALTKTLQFVPSASGLGMSANSSSTAAVLSNGTMGTPTKAPAATFTGGAKSAVEIETLAVFAWVGLATGFFLFA